MDEASDKNQKKLHNSEPYKEEIASIISLSKFAIICIMIAGGFLGQEFLL